MRRGQLTAAARSKTFMPSDRSGIISTLLATGSLPLSRAITRRQTKLNRAYDAADERTLCEFDQAALGAGPYRPASKQTTQVFYLGRFAWAFICDGVSPIANPTVLLSFKPTTTSHWDFFLADVRQEPQSRITAS